MEWLVAGAIGLLIGSGIYLLLEQRTFTIVLGMVLSSYGINLLVFATGRLVVNRPPVDPGSQAADPLPQALVLTAIVIGLATNAFALALALWSARRTGSDRGAGGREPPR
jgi:multicomponent K+:H+ antiporter subunit C